MGVPETQNRKKSKDSSQLTTCIELSGVEYHTHRVLNTQLVEQCSKRCLSVLVPFRLRHAYVDQALPAIHIRVPGEPGNEASIVCSSNIYIVRTWSMVNVNGHDAIGNKECTKTMYLKKKSNQEELNVSIFWKYTDL